MSTQFEIGQRVECISPFCKSMNSLVGKKGKIVTLDGGNHVGVEWEDWYGGHDCAGKAKVNQGYNGYQNEIKLIKQTLMVKITTMMKKLLDADTKKQVEAGFLDEQLRPTEAGKDALYTVLFGAHKKELTELAEEVIEEDKKNCK